MNREKILAELPKPSSPFPTLMACSFRPPFYNPPAPLYLPVEWPVNTNVDEYHMKFSSHVMKEG